MGREKTDFAALFKAPFIVLFKAMKNTIQFWLTHFKSDSDEETSKKSTNDKELQNTNFKGH